MLVCLQETPTRPTWQLAENSVNIWNLLWRLSRPLIIWIDQANISISTVPNTFTSKKAKNPDWNKYIFFNKRVRSLRSHTTITLKFKMWLFLSPGLTEPQVDASWKLGSTCDTVWPGLTYTCVDLRWLALTLAQIKFARMSTQVFHRLATQPKSTQVEWRPLACS